MKSLNKSVETNRRPASPFDAGRELHRALRRLCRRRSVTSDVLGRMPSLRKLTFLESCFLIFGVVVILTGLWLTIFPHELTAVMPAGRSNQNPYLVHLGKGACRSIGIGLVVFGTTVSIVAIYPFRR